MAQQEKSQEFWDSDKFTEEHYNYFKDWCKEKGIYFRVTPYLRCGYVYQVFFDGLKDTRLKFKNHESFPEFIIDGNEKNVYPKNFREFFDGNTKLIDRFSDKIEYFKSHFLSKIYKEQQESKKVTEIK